MLFLIINLTYGLKSIKENPFIMYLNKKYTKHLVNFSVVILDVFAITNVAYIVNYL